MVRSPVIVPPEAIWSDVVDIIVLLIITP